MTRTSTTFFRFSIATILGGAAFLWSGQLTLDPTSSLVSSAEARIGRPLTPLSYAGVARRTTRRAVVGGAVAAGAVAAGAYYAAPVVVGPACSQVADAYGRIVTVCR
jgi:subtilisin family serine protease